MAGIADHQMGLYVFQVQVPNVSLTLLVMNMIMNPSPAQPVARSVVQDRRVSADGVVAEDPLESLPGAVRPPDFEAEYRAHVRDALVDAMLDNSGALPMGPTDTLLVVASGIDPVVPNALYRSQSRKLVLKVKGADLASFRQGTITRDEAKQRIQATSF